MSVEELDLALGLLDHQIVDGEGRRCGKVDDLELDAAPGERAHVSALLIGPRYWPGRLRGPLGRVVTRLGGGRGVRVPWEEVTDVGSAVELRRRADELGLGRGDERARGLVARIPGS